MLKDPRSNRQSDAQLGCKAGRYRAELLPLMTIGAGNLLGEEDCEEGESGLYRTSVRCVSQTGRLYSLRREDFQKLQTQLPVWQAIMRQSRQKLVAYKAQQMRSRSSKFEI